MDEEFDINSRTSDAEKVRNFEAGHVWAHSQGGRTYGGT
jgi:hypothetical protein